MAITKKASKKSTSKEKASKKSAPKKSTPKKSKAAKTKIISDECDDDLPPVDDVVDIEGIDADQLAAEVERSEAKGESDEEVDSVEPQLAVDANAESADASDADAILPSMEGMSILRETELNDVIQDVKRRSEANGGYVTYEELNQILPSNIVDAIQSDKYLKILEALGVQVIREEDVKKYLEAKNAKATDPKAQKAEMIEDPIRMYLHQMGQVQLLKREEEVEICTIIEDAETRTKDMFNRFLFAPAMYARLLDKLEGQGERFDRIVTDKFDDNRDAYMELIPQFRVKIRDVEKRLRDASAKYLSTVAKKNPSQAAVRGAAKSLANARALLKQCFLDLSFKQKILETLCSDADERIYLPYRQLVSKHAQLLQLLDDAVAIGALPLPGTLQEAVTAQHLLGQALLGHCLDDLGLGGDGGVVGAGEPQSAVALHPLGADQDVLHGVVHGVAHVELTGDIGGRHDDGIGLLVLVTLGVEVAVALPHFVDGRLDLTGVVDLRQFSCHVHFLLFV
mgnify:CR=1 FL=1